MNIYSKRISDEGAAIRGIDCRKCLTQGRCARPNLAYNDVIFNWSILKTVTVVELAASCEFKHILIEVGFPVENRNHVAERISHVDN